MPEFRWTPEKETAAHDLAMAELTDAKIAEKAGVVRETIWAWKQSPEFTDRIDEHLSVIREKVRAQGIAILELRVRRLNDHWRRMQQVVEDRAADPDMANAPGGSTGLLVRKFKMIGSGDSATMVEEYEFDAALLKELREHEKQAAQELGQWTEKTSVEEIRKSYDTVNSPETL